MSSMWIDQPSSLVPWGICLGVSLAAATWDISQRRIPNRLTGPVWIAGLAWSCWMAGGQGVASAVAGSLLMAAPFILLFLFAGGGAGDAKLMGALGGWLGVSSGLVALVHVVAAGAIIGLVWAVAQRQLREVGRALWLMVIGMVMLPAAGPRASGIHIHDRPMSRHAKRAFPYGIAVFAGILTAIGGTILWRG